MAFKRQIEPPIRYKGLELSVGYRMDIVVSDLLILELKSVEKLIPIYEAQLLTYLRLSGIGLGLLLNFNVPVLKQGIKRLVQG
ncbi:MAG: hypothetical protein DRI56_04240 [Chloroflexota bacterium]|nr:MAG: hypothetical protein DRI56_04240 [Chloroflexota bacterium]